MWKRFLGIMAAALCVLNLTVGSAFSADLVKVPTAWLDEHETFLMWYAKEKGWDKEAGLDIEMKLFNSGPDILNALPTVIKHYQSLGYTIVPVSELLLEGPYTIDVQGKQHPAATAEPKQ